ncbi:helicase-related protein, partial [Rhodospirillaceae bacterium]|nr:helicase-related protein [Rhodospirillaceae bacterium]
RSLVQTHNKIETDAQSFASHVGLAKAIDSYDLRRVITFHSKVKSANEFQKDFPDVIDWMPSKSRPSGSFVTNYVSGAMSTSDRNQNLRRLGELEEGERAILANARCLSEGIDVPALDGVAFIDPRNSEIDIVQAVGRAIRLSSAKDVGTIIIPVFIRDYEDPDEVLDGSVFKKVWAVVNALRSHDEGLGIELDNLRKALGKKGSIGKSVKIHFDLPTQISIAFEKALSVRLIESTT